MDTNIVIVCVFLIGAMLGIVAVWVAQRLVDRGRS